MVHITCTLVYVFCIHNYTCQRGWLLPLCQLLPEDHLHLDED